ncbi:MAG: hypothetical protein ISN28_11295 [Ectothiorhodospiraceae bacterium AqS1]|nr:hypothetical protein [Ectothiorhodospiraceae bacterium AqS1]
MSLSHDDESRSLSADRIGGYSLEGPWGLGFDHAQKGGRGRGKGLSDCIEARQSGTSSEPEAEAEGKGIEYRKRNDKGLARFPVCIVIPARIGKRLHRRCERRGRV